jgi:putative flippase GtrA
MLVIILLECLGLSYLLTRKWKNHKAYLTAVLSNVISGIIGIIGSFILNGGWWLVVWFPWVSDHEVRSGSQFDTLILFYLLAFVVTLLIEWLVNYLFLRKHYAGLAIFKATLLINIISYAVGSIALYSYSF